MLDEELHQRINALAAEEHQLISAHRDGHGLTDEERIRLRRLEVSLDRAWDLLRQRAARRSAGLDPDGAVERDGATVENYLS
jgi:hypothetical protein